MERYTRGMDLDPSNAVLPANRAMALLKLRRYEKGIIKMDWMDGVISVYNGKPWFTYFFCVATGNPYSSLCATLEFFTHRLPCSFI